MDCGNFHMVGKLLFGGMCLIDICRNIGITPTAHEKEQRRQAKTDPGVKWDRFDELSYSIRLLLPRVVTWLGLIGILMWNVA